MDWLGDTREKIGFEKAHIYRSGKPAICSDPSPPQSLLDHAAAIGADLWLFSRDFNYSGDRQQWAYGGREQPQRAGLSRCAAPTSCSTPRRRWPRWNRCANCCPCRSRPCAWGCCRLRCPAVSDPARPARRHPGRGAQSPRRRGAGAEPGQHGFPSVYPRGLRHAERQGPGGRRRQAGLARRPLVLRRPAGPRGASGEDLARQVGQALPPRQRAVKIPACRPMPIPPRPSRQRANGLPRMIESWCSGRFSPWPRFCRPWVARHRQERGQSGLDSVHRQGGGKPPRRPPKGAARNSLPWVFQTQRSCRPGAVLKRAAVPSEVQAAELRGRARRRLAGAIALVLAAVIVLPMVLDSQPVPVADNIPSRCRNATRRSSPR